ncbi:hypothetical protein QBC47DRAFT_382201 [Echria macrotheca]|uniref:Uncharacterized protein n=1 Tax=Echria macrotheca TaxID=438768 RepID=A0AAJ0BBU0_9PEZI|nr:hypothetical protein QBC47DRAFT_382201 [Echria macrotheca]
MGWLGGWFGGSNESDPLRRLDPKTREYLERESPVKYTTVTDQQRREREREREAQQEDEAAARQQRQLQQHQQQAKSKQGGGEEEKEEGEGEGKIKVPPQSLFQDGRYAHLWKTYRPQAEVEAEGKSEHEKLQDVLEGFKERRGLIGRAALENCAEAQLEWNNCMKYGDWGQRAVMCRDEVRRFERCYLMNSRLLKTLGYMSDYSRGPEVEEQIQMRADAIFQKMLAQEAEVEKAKEEGRPVPKFGSLVPSYQAPKPITVPAAAMPQGQQQQLEEKKKKEEKEKKEEGAKGGEGEHFVVSYEPGEERLKEWRQKVEKLPERDREAELEALKADYRAKVDTALRVNALWDQQRKERLQRKEEGTWSVMDRVKDFFGR